MLACFSLTESLETTALPCTKAAGGVMRSPHDEHPPQKKPARSTSPEGLACALNCV